MIKPIGKLRLFHADGKITVSDRYGRPTLTEAQGWVDGYIQVFILDKKTMVVLDEEGKIKGKPINRAATELVWRIQPRFSLAKDYLVGTVAFIEGDKAWLD